MPTPEENYLLLWSLLRQRLNPNGGFDGVDWNAVKDDLKFDKTHNAQVRMTKLKVQFSKLGFPGLPHKSEGKGVGTTESMEALKAGGKKEKDGKEVKPKKTANPKARSAVTKKTAGGAKGRGKGKVEKVEDGDGDEVMKEDSASGEETARAV
jgi:hypothetical protein